MKKLFLLAILTLASFSCKKEPIKQPVSITGNYEVIQKSEFWMITDNGDTLSTLDGGDINEVVDVTAIQFPFEVNGFATVNGEDYVIQQFVYDDKNGKPWVHQLWLEKYDKTNLQEGNILNYHLGKRE